MPRSVPVSYRIFASSRFLLLGGSLLALAACSSAPREYPPLATLEQRFEAARAEQVPANAPVRFQEAERTLAQARSRLGEADEAELEHLTRLAATRLDTAVTEAQARETREQRRTLLSDRQRLMLEEREEQLRQREEELAMARQQLSEFEQRQTQQGLLLTIRQINFDLDSASLSPGDQERLAPLADYLRENPDRRILIEGHTDSTGAADYNRDLSQRRAEAVRNYLATRGVDPSRIETVGRGQDVPVADNRSEAGRLQNRRIEVTIRNPGVA